MKKIILSVATLSAALAQAQVGINQETPKATLDISVKKANETTNSQEGLLIPRVTKEKALKMANNSTAPEESVLIYVNDVASFTSAPDDKVNDITEKGYYFWNGTKWVKSSGANGELWAQRENNGVTETYLKAADTNNDFVGYKSNKKFGIKLGAKISLDPNADWVPENVGLPSDFKGFDENEVPLWRIVSSNALPLTGTLGTNNRSYFFNADLFSVGVEHVNNATSEQKVYEGTRSLMVAGGVEPATSDVLLMVGNTYGTSYNLKGNRLTGQLIGAQTVSSVGQLSVVNKNTAATFLARNAGETKSLTALITTSQNKGEVETLKGIENHVISRLEETGGASPSHTVKSVRGIDNNVLISENATVEEGVSNINSILNISKNVNFEVGKVLYGEHNRVRLGSNLSENNVYVSQNAVDLKENLAGAKNIYLNQSVITSIGENSNIAKDLYGFDFRNYNKNNWKSDKMYGIYLDEIINGQTANYGLFIDNVGNTTSTDNYAIYTKKGNIRFGQLKGSGERLVTANDDGVLATSNKTLADLESLWANDDTNNLVKLKATSNGTPRVNTPGSRNDVTIDNDGKITAKAFIGYNGATIFPDYVFEKYYTGKSTIKADYNFHNLASVESFIKTNGHLPGYQSAKEIASKGLIDLGATQLTNVEKIEELYLHTIEQEKALKAKDAKIEKLENELNDQKMRLDRLEKLLTK